VRGPSKPHAVAVLVPGPTHPDLPGQGVKVDQWSYTTLVDLTLDGSLGARAALQQARSLLTDASERLTFSVSSTDRRRVGLLVADLASLVGW